MELNEKTLKEGITLYYLHVKHWKKNSPSWQFTFNKAKITKVEEYLSSYLIKFTTLMPNTNPSSFDAVRLRNTAIVSDLRLHNNTEQFLTINECNGYWYEDYEFLSDSFKILIKVLKDTFFTIKGNEMTKKKRLRIYRELIRRWTKSEFKENFYTDIE